LLIKDSFSNCFAPFLLDNYNRIIMVDYRYGKESVGSIIEKNESEDTLQEFDASDLFGDDFTE